jgi:hypothetical protein
MIVLTFFITIVGNVLLTRCNDRYEKSVKSVEHGTVVGDEDEDEDATMKSFNDDDGNEFLNVICQNHTCIFLLISLVDEGEAYDVFGHGDVNARRGSYMSLTHSKCIM